MSQQTFTFKPWGGARAGAGRKAAPGRRPVAHRLREVVYRSEPVHVTLRVREHVWNLRSERCFRVVHRVLEEQRAKAELQVVEYAVQGNHVHLLVEAEGNAGLARGMRSLTIKLTHRLNRMMGLRGPVFEGRYHAHPLRTQAEARNALRYVRGNFASHASRRGEQVSAAFVDPYSSAAVREPRVGQLGLWPVAVTAEPRTWLMGRAKRVQGKG
ncbi:MAG: transposase [Anaeromyxobacter sp.]